MSRSKVAASFSFVAGFALAAVATSGHHAPVSSAAGHRVAASATIDWNNRCKVAGFANDAAITYMVDTGAPAPAYFSDAYLGKLGISASSLEFEDLWPGTRYGKVATARLRELRVGDFVANDLSVKILQRWEYTFGRDDTPLLGIGTLSRGLRLEVSGDICKLTY